MPAKSQSKTLVVCPHCGHQQMEPRAAISSNCRQCGQYLRVQELLNPAPKAAEKAPEQKRVACFDCRTEMEVPAAAKSAMCKKCSSYMDLQDYSINNAVSKNFRTKGRFVVEAKGYVFNAEVLAREVVIKGRVIGKFAAEQSFTIYSQAEINGTIRTPLLVIPENNVFHWKEPTQCGSLEVQGEVVGNVRAEGTVSVRRTGRLFGRVEAAGIVVEEGAIIVGDLRIGNAPAVTHPGEK